jgi:hypothetical protein
MESGCNPRQRKGERNVFCPYYGECLDYAITRAWESWNCSGCKHRTDQEAEPEFQQDGNDAVAYYEVITKI